MKFNKKLFICTLMIFFAASMIFAEPNANTSTGLKALKELFSTIYAFFTSTYMLVICTVGLVWVGIQMITNKGEPVVTKKLIPMGCAFLLIGGSSAIVQLFFKPNVEVSNVTNSSTATSGAFKDLFN